MKTNNVSAGIIRPITGLERIAVWKHLKGMTEDDIMLRFGISTRPETMKSYVQKINLNRDLALGVFINNQLMGFAHGATYDEGGWQVTEVGLSVNSCLQGQGWGTKLLDAAIELARKNGSIKLIVNTLTRNQAIRRILKKRGGEERIEGQELSAEFVLQEKDVNFKMQHSMDNGIEIIEKIVSVAAPTILLVHGAGGDAWQWRSHVMPELAKNGINSLAFSLPDHGNSGHQEYEFDDYLGLIERCHQKIGTENAVVAHSMGGFLTQHYLAKTQAESKSILVSSLPPFNVANFNKGFLGGVASNLKCTQARNHLHHFLDKVQPVATERVRSDLSFVAGKYDKVVPIEWQKTTAFHYRSVLHELDGGHNLMNGKTSDELSKIIYTTVKN